MGRNQFVLVVTDEQRSELSKRAASRRLPAGEVFRARLILALANGQSYSIHHMNTSGSRELQILKSDS
jgi:hypothetical protein